MQKRNKLKKIDTQSTQQKKPVAIIRRIFSEAIITKLFTAALLSVLGLIVRENDNRERLLATTNYYENSTELISYGYRLPPETMMGKLQLWFSQNFAFDIQKIIDFIVGLFVIFLLIQAQEFLETKWRMHKQNIAPKIAQRTQRFLGVLLILALAFVLFYRHI